MGDSVNKIDRILNAINAISLKNIFLLERHKPKMSSEEWRGRKKAEKKEHTGRGRWREVACVVLTSVVRKGAFSLLLAITQR